MSSGMSNTPHCNLRIKPTSRTHGHLDTTSDISNCHLMHLNHISSTPSSDCGEHWSRTTKGCHLKP